MPYPFTVTNPSTITVNQGNSSANETATCLSGKTISVSGLSTSVDIAVTQSVPSYTLRVINGIFTDDANIASMSSMSVPSPSQLQSHLSLTPLQLSTPTMHNPRRSSERYLLLHCLRGRILLLGHPLLQPPSKLRMYQPPSRRSPLHIPTRRSLHPRSHRRSRRDSQRHLRYHNRAARRPDRPRHHIELREMDTGARRGYMLSHIPQQRHQRRSVHSHQPVYQRRMFRHHPTTILLRPTDH